MQEKTDRIFEILHISLGVRKELLCKENWNIPFFEPPFHFNFVHMMYLYLELERQFNIDISNMDVSEYPLIDVNSILHIVSSNDVDLQ